MRAVVEFSLSINKRLESFFGLHLNRLGQFYAVWAALFTFGGQVIVRYINCNLTSTKYIRHTFAQGSFVYVYGLCATVGV